MRHASLGSISHGTVRTEDLLATFASELEGLVQRNPDLPPDERAPLLTLAEEARAASAETGEAEVSDDLVLELMDALDLFAPPYCQFGAHEGDRSDFGFWPILEQIEELPRVQDSDEAKALGEPCAFVNDHGNVTVYSGEGRVILDLV